MEIWKPIEGYYGMYLVSNLGRVKSIDRCSKNRLGGVYFRTGRILKFWVDCNGREQIQLCKNSITEHFQVHTLVLTAFVGLRPKGMECCHNDSNSLNNKLENLRWDTHINNEADKILNGTSNKGERNGRAITTVNQVLSVRRLLKCEYLTSKDIASIVGITLSVVSNIRSNTNWKHIKLEEE